MASTQSTPVRTSAPASLFRESAPNLETEICPLCEQTIPTEKLVEIQQRERQRAVAQEQELRSRFEREKATLIAQKDTELEHIRKNAAASLEQTKQDGLKREADARNTAKKEAEAAMSEKVTASLQAKTTAEARLKTIEDEKTALIAQKDTELEQIRKNAATALEQTKQDGLKREADARNTAKKEAEAAMSEKVTASLQAKTTAEARLKTIEDEKTALIAQKDTELEQTRKNAAAALEQTKQDALKREADARNAAKKEVEAAMSETVTTALQAKITAEARLKTVEDEQGERLQKALAEQRGAIEKDKTLAVLKEQSKAFEDRQKLEGKLEDLQRQLKKERADDLGESAELNLEAALRSEFPADRFHPIDKGVAGADLWQDVVHNNEICGRIVYDSKNRNAWRNDYVSKLKTDQIDAKGDYAVLATRVFPNGTKQLHVQDGVLLAHPARVVVLTTLLREQLISTHRLQLSAQEQNGKTTALYEFITSERCHQIFDHCETILKDMLDLDVAEKKQHESTWKKRGEMIKKTERAIVGQLRSEIDRIIEDGASA